MTIDLSWHTFKESSSKHTEYFNLTTKRFNKHNGPHNLPLQQATGLYLNNHNQAYNFEYISIPMNSIMYNKTQHIIYYQWSLIAGRCPVCQEIFYHGDRINETDYYCPYCNSIFDDHSEYQPEENQWEHIQKIKFRNFTHMILQSSNGTMIVFYDEASNPINLTLPIIATRNQMLNAAIKRIKQMNEYELTGATK